MQTMSASDEAELGAESVNFDVATGADPQFSRALSVRSIWIGNVQGAIESAFRILPIDRVEALGSLVVSLPLFGANGLASQRDLVSLQHIVAATQSQVRFDFSITILSACLAVEGIELPETENE